MPIVPKIYRSWRERDKAEHERDRKLESFVRKLRSNTLNSNATVASRWALVQLGCYLVPEARAQEWLAEWKERAKFKSGLSGDKALELEQNTRVMSFLPGMIPLVYDYFGADVSIPQQLTQNARWLAHAPKNESLEEAQRYAKRA